MKPEDACPDIVTAGNMLESLIADAQSILVEYLVPGGIDAQEAINRLLGLFDGPAQRQAQEAWATFRSEFKHASAAERERCAKAVEPKGSRPCDCQRCDCGNVGDAESVAAWDERTYAAAAIRALEDQP